MPEQATGPGAIVWAAAAGCGSGAGARIDPISPDGTPQRALAAYSAAGLRLGPLAPLEVAAAPHGLIAIAGANPAGAERGLFLQGAAGGPFAPLIGARQVQPLALANGYLGDLGILAARPGGGLKVELERWYAHRVTPRGLITGAHTTQVTAATLALDFRSDALAVWVSDGQLYARDEPGSGHLHLLQRLGPASGTTRVAALLSDDNRGIVLWVESSDATTSVYLDYSRAGVRFGAPQLIERFTYPAGEDPPGAPRLIRLSDESVMAAWPGSEAGHQVLRVAPIDQNGLRTITTIAAPDGDAVLDALAPGPHGEAFILWGQPLAGADGAGPGRQSLEAARGIDTAPGVARFGPAELVSGPGAVSGATLAVDPASQRAIAAWVGENGTIRWSVRGSPPPG
jgi:hypothetical protein